MSTPKRASKSLSAARGAEQVRVSVLINESHQKDMRTVVARLRKQGFEPDKNGSLEAIGVVTGSVRADKLDPIRRTEGVGSVEEQRDDYRPVS
jgi:hypothetical protein